MRFGRLFWWRREVSGLAGGGPERALRRRGLVRRLRGPVAMLAGVPMLSVSLVAGVSLAAGGAGVAEAASASGAGNTTIFAGIDQPEGITAGPDGNLWFTNSSNNTIGRITPAGHVHVFAGHGIDGPAGITAGPDGALWFTNNGGSIGRITTSGAVTTYTGTGINGPEGITAGPDGALWFTNQHNDSIGRITTAVTPAISGFTPDSGAAGTTVTITGHNLAGATAVAFGGTPATIVSATATQLVTTVPAGAATGHITVTTPAGTATSHASFTVT